MRSILFSIFMLITVFSYAQSSLTYSQVNDSEYEALSQNLPLNAIFQNKLYLAGDSNNTKVKLISTSTATNNSFVSETGINSVIVNSGTETKISAMVAGINEMFFGTSIMSPSAQPKVYKYDGSSYSVFGSLPFSGGAFDYSYSKISKLIYWSPSGNEDSIVAFVDNVGNGIEAFISPINSPNWSLFANFSSSYGNTYSAKVWNNKLFFGTKSPTGIVLCRLNSSMVIDSVANQNFGQLTGSLYAIAAIEEYNNELYVVANRLNGTDDFIFRSADEVTWNPVVTGGFITTENYGSIDFVKANNRIFALIQNSGTSQNMAVYTTLTPQVGTSFDIVSGSAPFNLSSTYDFTVHQIFQFRDSIFVSVKHIANNKMELYGALFSTAKFTPPASALCSGMPYTFLNTSANYNSTVWKIDGITQPLFTDLTHTFNTAGSYEITLIVTNIYNALSDSIKKTINVITGIDSVLISQPDTLCHTLPNIMYSSVYGGVGPFTYDWQRADIVFNYTSVGFADTLVFSDTLGSTPYRLFVTSSNGCQLMKDYYAQTITTSSIDGIGFLNGNWLDSGLVQLFKYQPGNGLASLYDSAPLTSFHPYFSFSAYPGSYLLKVTADTSVYPNTIPTYYGDTYIWDSSTVVVQGCTAAFADTVFIIQPLGGGGNGVISGKIQQGANFGNRLMIPGDPIPGVGVNMGRKPGGQAQMRTVTDAFGNYTFTGVPIGDYWIFTDLENLPMDSTRVISITATDTVSIGNDYWADSSHVYIENTVGTIELESMSEGTIIVFPNPTSGMLNVKFTDLSQENISLEIYNTLGELVYRKQQRVNGTNSVINLNDTGKQLKPGLYQILVEVSNKKYAQKFIVSKP